jgi:hypothetical protein
MHTRDNVHNTEPQKGLLCTRCKKDVKLYLACFDFTRQLQQYWNKWILNEGWIDMLQDSYPAILNFPLLI